MTLSIFVQIITTDHHANGRKIKLSEDSRQEVLASAEWQALTIRDFGIYVYGIENYWMKFGERSFEIWENWIWQNLKVV